MKRINWRLAILPDLAHSAAPRVLSTQVLCEMIAFHRPHIAKATMQSVLQDLVAISAVRQITPDVFINLRCSPPAVLAEAANYIRKEAVVSLQSVLYESGVIQHRGNIITAVLPDSHLALWDKEIIYADNNLFEFHVLPGTYFPPALTDHGDIMDLAKSYPCFTPEKALLDWLYSEKFVNAELPPLSRFDLTKLNIERLFGLAKQMKLRYLLEHFLNPSTAPICSSNSANPSSAPLATGLGVARISGVLDSLRKVWELNPELSLSQVLKTICRKGAAGGHLDVNHADWQDALVTVQSAMMDNADTRSLGPLNELAK